MVSGLWGKKIGMTQVFSKKNTVVPVTVIDFANWFVTNIRTKERDGYTAVQVGRVKDRYAKNAFSIVWLKNFKRYFSFIREIKVKEEDISSLPVIGKPADFITSLAEGSYVDVFGKTKGCGFAGVVRRHNFSGAPKSHGHTMGKRPGSIGSFCSQGKVIKGKAMPGQMGNKQDVTKNLEVIKIEQGANVLLVKGAIPGRSGSLVFVRKEIG